MRIKTFAICFVSSAAFVFAAQPAWEFAPPDAKILIGVDIRGLRNSSLSDSTPPETRAQVQAAMTMLHVPGIELLDDIDSVFLASTADVSGLSKAAPPDAPKSGAAPGKPGPRQRNPAPHSCWSSAARSRTNTYVLC